jgi:hypothetical protein
MKTNGNFLSLIRKSLLKVNIIYYLDFILFGLIIFYLAYNLLCSIFYFIDIISVSESSFINIVCNVTSGDVVQNDTTLNTTVQIIHDENGWSSAIRELFIYGTGALRLHLVRGGTPGSRGFIIASTLVADGLSRVVNNTINDTEYVKKNIKNWKEIWQDSGVVRVDVDASTANKI